MATKKGIAVTAAIVAGVVGASFIVWFLPQGNAGTVITPPLSYQDILSEVYSRHHDLAASVDVKFEEWKSGQLAAEDMLATIDSAENDAYDMRKRLADARPEPRWQDSYESYIKALDAFIQYLGVMEQSVQSGDRSGSDSRLDELKRQSQSRVDESIESIPV